MEFVGVEVEFNSNLSDKLSLFGNYTFQDSEYDDPDVDFPVVFWLNLPPEHKANLGIRYKLYEDTLLTADLLYKGERENEGGFNINDSLVADVGAEHTLNEKVKLLLWVNNVFDKDYEEVYGFPMPGTTVGIEAKITLF